MYMYINVFKGFQNVLILSTQRLCIINNRCTLIDTRTKNVYIEGFDRMEIDYIINHIAEV